jgi:single-stranded DNA-binding protein
MTVAVLVSGSLFKNPELKTSRSGKTYATASIRTASADNSAADFWNLLVFSTSVQEELLRLSEGDKLAVQGSVKLEIYNGKISRSVFVDAILPLRAPPREKKPKAAKPAPTSQGLAEQSHHPAPPSSDVEGPTERAPSSFYDDDIPF